VNVVSGLPNPDKFIAVVVLVSQTGSAEGEDGDCQAVFFVLGDNDEFPPLGIDTAEQSLRLKRCVTCGAPTIPVLNMVRGANNLSYR